MHQLRHLGTEPQLPCVSLPVAQSVVAGGAEQQAHGTTLVLNQGRTWLAQVRASMIWTLDSCSLHASKSAPPPAHFTQRHAPPARTCATACREAARPFQWECVIGRTCTKGGPWWSQLVRATARLCSSSSVACRGSSVACRDRDSLHQFIKLIKCRPEPAHAQVPRWAPKPRSLLPQIYSYGIFRAGPGACACPRRCSARPGWPRPGRRR